MNIPTTPPAKPAPVKQTEQQRNEAVQKQSRLAKQEHQKKLLNAKKIVSNLSIMTNPSLYETGYEKLAATAANRIMQEEMKKNGVDLKKIDNFNPSELVWL